MALIKRATAVLFFVAIILSMSPSSLAGVGHNRSPSLPTPPKRLRRKDCVRASFKQEFCRDEMCTPECTSHGHPGSNAYCKSRKNNIWDCCCPPYI
ncbi:unnamed protein product [Urochloa decumbens]|uniref:Uncharacterized protein n=1 Tax=Urochloa decumbens TaxID=240449 RepID=A0ABC9BAH6_9POAL